MSRKKDMELGLSEAELFLADALSDGWEDEKFGGSEEFEGDEEFKGSDNTQEPTPFTSPLSPPSPPPYAPAPPLKESIYLAMRVQGGRIEIEGEPTDYLLGVAEWVLSGLKQRNMKENSND